MTIPETTYQGAAAGPWRPPPSIHNKGESMIKKFYSKRKEMPGWKRDPNTGQFWSWGYDIWLRNPKRRVRESGFATRGDAEAAVGRIRQAEKDKKYGFTRASAQPLVSDLVERRLASIYNPRELTYSKRVLGAFLAVLPAGLRVPELAPPHGQLFVERRLAAGLQPQSVSRELNSVVACLNAARTFFPQLEQWVPPRLPRPKYSKRRRERVITAEEVQKLLAHLLAPRQEGERESATRARRHVGLVVRFALLTGMRHGEISQLRWDHLDRRALSLKVIGTKTQNVSNPTRYITPLTPTMLEIIDERRRRSSTPFIFTHAGVESPKFYTVLRKACEACGIPYGQKTPGGFVLHDARHTATTRLLQAGVDLSTIQSITGHSDEVMILYYGHATTESRQRAAAALEAYAGEPETDEPQQDAAEYVN